MKFPLRIMLLTFVASLMTLVSKAQNGYDFSRYDLGASFAVNSFFGDTKTPQTTQAVNFNFSYNQTAFINYILEAQVGKLAGGNATLDAFGRQFSADYTYYAFRVQAQAGEFIDYSSSRVMNALKNFYAGAGLGVIYSNITSINRYSTRIPGFYSPGANSANELFLPTRFGYEFKIFNKSQRPDVKIDLAYQFNVVFGDELDGFKAGKYNDYYSQFSIGVKFSVGGVTSNRKQITY